MSFWRRKPMEVIPVVPDDVVERKSALQQSARGYAAALRQVPEVATLTTSIQTHNDNNHYAVRLRETYGYSGA